MDLELALRAKREHDPRMIQTEEPSRRSGCSCWAALQRQDNWKFLGHVGFCCSACPGVPFVASESCLSCSSPGSHPRHACGKLPRMLCHRTAAGRGLVLWRESSSSGHSRLALEPYINLMRLSSRSSWALGVHHDLAVDLQGATSGLGAYWKEAQLFRRNRGNLPTSRVVRPETACRSRVIEPIPTVI